MYKIFIVEINKMKDPVKIISMLLAIFLLTGMVSVFEFNMMFKNINSNFQEEYMLFNLTFVLIKIMLPIILILLTTSIFAGEYASGNLKSFLICGINRKKYYWGKIIYILAITIIFTLVIFFALSLPCFIIGNIRFFFSEAFFKIFFLYLAAGVGTIPIILVTVFISFLLNDFEKTITCSLVVLFLSLTCDSVMEHSFYGLTGILSNCNLFYAGSLKNIFTAFVIGILYFLLLNVINLSIFERKDIWS